ncbi:ABC transporter permease [Streptomyces sp.]|uniref:ABC transporter permease n=1 Tax=Streptomyces sp. TaxID=1931 RepID=UPI002F42397E
MSSQASAYEVPDWLSVAFSVVFVATGYALVVRGRLGLGRDVLVVACRAAVQLIAIGAILSWLFTHAGLPGSLAWVAAMVLIAGQVAGRRGAGLPRPRLVATLAIGVATGATMAVLLAAHIVGAPRTVVPVGGMVVNAILPICSVALARLREEVERNRAEVEARLVLGLSAAESVRPRLRAVLRTALLPPIDATKVVGLITLPGAMTGLILAGVPPLLAIRYQLVVVYISLSAPAMGAVLVGKLMTRQLFDDALRLRPLSAPGTGPGTGPLALFARRKKARAAVG